jgi:hypothetical protein
VSDPAARLRAAATLLRDADIATVEHVQPGQGRTIRTLDTEALAAWLLAEAREYDKTGVCFSDALAFADSVLTDPEGESRG